MVRVDPSSQDWYGALNGLGCGTAEPVARFRFDVGSGIWWWSQEMFALHGFVPGEVVPSTELLMAHKHPQDRTRTVTRLQHVLADGQPFCCRHRIVDATGKIRTVLSLGEGICDDSGSVRAVHGFFIDVTDSTHREAQEEAQEAVRRSAESRAVIEQAKGALVAVFGIDADSAFAVLRARSQNGNIKLRDVADGLVQHLGAGGTDELTPQQRVSAYLHAAPSRDRSPVRSATDGPPARLVTLSGRGADEGVGPGERTGATLPQETDPRVGVAGGGAGQRRAV